MAEEQREFSGKASCTCDASQEREFSENLLNQRFNFFLVFFGLVLGGSSAARNADLAVLILQVGTIICWLLALPIFRIQYKFDIIFRELLPQNHPAKVADRKARKSFITRISLRGLIGYWIPFLCCCVLTVMTILVGMGKLTFFWVALP